MTKGQFNAALLGLQRSRLVIRADDSRNADSIRAIDAQLGNANAILKKLGYIKPEFCNCDCEPKRDSAQ
jgi:hypothetical protein